MTLPSPTQASDMALTYVSSSAVATVLYIPVLKPGRVKDFHVTVGAALTTANETFQLAYAPPGSTTFTNIANGVLTQLTSGSAAGTTVRVQIPPSTDAYVQDGGTLRITPAGGGAGAVPLGVGVVVGA